MGYRFTAEIEIAGDAATAFENLVEELTIALDQRGLRFQPGPTGRIADRKGAVARIVEWETGERILLESSAVREPAVPPVRIGLTFTPAGKDTLVRFEASGVDALAGALGDVAGWFASRFAAPLMHALTPEGLADWVTDRQARWPSGRDARATYRDPLYHYPNFRVILEELSLGPEDHLLEVGCGGGAMLNDALRSDCRAAAIDHSLDMIRVAREVNREAIGQHRLYIAQAAADRLPFRENTFTCAAMTGVLGFLADPVEALAEIRRTLVTGGRLVVLGSDPALRGTLAAPEPFASRLRFYDDDQFEALGRGAGFGDVTIIHRDLEQHARAVGVPEEHVPLFTGPTSFLVARKG